MKTSQWRRAVENRCVFGARLKALSDRSAVTVVLVADGLVLSWRVIGRPPHGVSRQWPVVVRYDMRHDATGASLSSWFLKRFDVAGPLTAHLRCPVAVRTRGTGRVPVAADRRCWRPEMAVAGTQIEVGLWWAVPTNCSIAWFAYGSYVGYSNSVGSQCIIVEQFIAFVTAGLK